MCSSGMSWGELSELHLLRALPAAAAITDRMLEFALGSGQLMRAGSLFAAAGRL